MTLPRGDRFHSIPICIAVYVPIARQKVAPLANTASPYLSWKSGESALPLFAGCFELGGNLACFGQWKHRKAEDRTAATAATGLLELHNKYP